MRTFLRALLLLLVVPGAGIGLAVFVGRWLVLRSLRADAAKLSGWAPGFPTDAVLLWSRVWSLYCGVPWSLQLAVVHNEGASSPRPPTAAELATLAEVELAPPLVYPLGDLGVNYPHLYGPAVGAGQALASTIDALWDSVPWWLAWAVRPAGSGVRQLALPGQEWRALYWSARILSQALSDAGGDLHTAARYYNGGAGTTSDASESYADRADTARAALSAAA